MNQATVNRSNTSHVWCCPIIMCNVIWITRTTRTPAFWDIPHRPMITYNSDSHQIPSQKKTNSKLQVLKKLPKIQILKFCKKLYLGPVTPDGPPVGPMNLAIRRAFDTGLSDIIQCCNYVITIWSYWYNKHYLQHFPTQFYIICFKNSHMFWLHSLQKYLT